MDLIDIYWGVYIRIDIEYLYTKIKNFLVEGGFLKKESDGSFKIIKPIIDEEVIKEIKENGSKKILEIMLY